MTPKALRELMTSASYTSHRSVCAMRELPLPSLTAFEMLLSLKHKGLGMEAFTRQDRGQAEFAACDIRSHGQRLDHGEGALATILVMPLDIICAARELCD